MDIDGHQGLHSLVFFCPPFIFFFQMTKTLFSGFKILTIEQKTKSYVRGIYKQDA